MYITVGFSKPKNKLFPIFSWAIRAIYRTEYSHVYVKWHSKGANAEIIYEASGTSVHFTCKDVFDEKAERIHEYELDISKEQYRKLLHFCMTNAGRDYGLKQAAGIGLKEIFNLEKNPFSDGKDSQVCSELVANILDEVVDLDLGIDFDTASPPDIKEFLDRHSEIAKKTL